MEAKLVLECLNIALVGVCLASVAIMWKKGVIREFPWVFGALALRVVYGCIYIPLLFHRKELGIDRHLAYAVFVYAFWCNFVLDGFLFGLILYGVYKVAMKPLAGLKKAGNIIFRWVGVVSLLFSISMFVGPHMGGASAVAILTERLQQGISVVTLCLLVFVCFAIKPLGLTFRSRVFGVSLGLGIWATTNLVEAAWYTTMAPQSLYSVVYFISTAGCLAAMLVWAVYFAVPEPERRMVLLPTTSPFFLWNRVSEALGDAPGYVAIAGFRPEMLEPAELKVLTAASKMARERRAEAEAQQSSSSMAQVVALHSMTMPR
jgi:hypothetical protein